MMNCKTGRWQKCTHLKQQQLEVGPYEAHDRYLRTRKRRAGSSKKGRDPENMVQNCQDAVRAGNSLGTAGTPHGTGSQEQAARGTRAATVLSIRHLPGERLRLGQDMGPWACGGQDQTQPCEGRIWPRGCASLQTVVGG